MSAFVLSVHLRVRTWLHAGLAGRATSLPRAFTFQGCTGCHAAECLLRYVYRTALPEKATLCLGEFLELGNVGVLSIHHRRNGCPEGHNKGEMDTVPIPLDNDRSGYGGTDFDRVEGAAWASSAQSRAGKPRRGSARGHAARGMAGSAVPSRCGGGG